MIPDDHPVDHPPLAFLDGGNIDLPVARLVI